MRFRVDGLRVARAGRRVLSGATFTLQGGDLAALRGPNGAGKSTLLRALAGLTRPEGGEALIDDAALTVDPERYRERVLLSGHLDAVKPTLTVSENLLFWARFFGAPEMDAADRVAGALDRFALMALAEAPAGTCSAGQKRRLGLARLAVADRPVWLLDEPTVSLDAASTAAFDALVKAHCAGGGIVLAASHIAWPEAPSHRLDIADFIGSRTGGASAADGAPDPFLDGDWSET